MTVGDPAAPSRTRGPLIFCLFICAALLAADIFLIVARGSNVPSWDDWDNIPVLTGHQPLSIEWLWSEHNEHRDPLPRLIIVALNRYIALDFRTAMYFNVLACAGIAAALIFALRKARGYSSYLDAFIPITILHWGQAENFLWGWQVQFYASALLLCAALIFILRIQGVRDSGLIFIAGACVALLPSCGANGLVLVPAMAVWLGYAVIVVWKSSKARALKLAIIFLITVGLLGLYFVDYHPVPYHPTDHSLRAMLKTASEFITMAFGPGVVGLDMQHNPMRHYRIVCALVVTVLVLTILLLLWAWWKRRDERLRSSGILMFIGAMCAIALAMGLGREGFETRYVTLSFPILCGMYAAWSLYGPSRTKSLVPALMLFVAIAALVPNMSWGWGYSSFLKTNYIALEKDVRAGLPPYLLIHRHSDWLHPHDPILDDYLPMLRDAKVGAFAQMADNPKFTEISLPIVPSKMWGMKWDNGTAIATDEYPWLELTLPQETYVAGIRIRYTFEDSKNIAPYFVVYWRNEEETGFSKAKFKKASPTGDYAVWKQLTWTRLQDPFVTMDVWPCDKVKTIRIGLFSTMGTTKFLDVTLLLPPKDQTPATQPISQTSSHPASHPAEPR